MNVISIAPVGGLCNRMRALNASLALSSELGSRLELVWYLDRSLNCRFEELFLIPDGLANILTIDMNCLFGVLAKKLLIAQRSWLGRHLYDQDFIAAAMNRGTDLRRDFAGKNVFVETCSAYYPCANFDRFVPVAALAERIRCYTDIVTDAVGIHLRRTDNQKSLQYSSVDQFVAKMQELLAAGRCSRFFLATDSPADESYLKEIFREKIVTHQKSSYDRNNSTAIKEALVDLYCLAQCQLVVGSHWSSFSETAAKIGHRELLIIKGGGQ